MAMHEIPLLAGWFKFALLGLVVAAVIIFVVRALANRSGTQVAWTLAGIIVAGFVLTMFSFRMDHQVRPPMVVYEQPLTSPPYRQHGHGYGGDAHEHAVPEKQNQGVISPRIDVNHEEALKPKVSGSTPQEPETKTFTPDTTTEKQNNEKQIKPAWLTQGKQQMPNGNPMFPVSSELFATVTECQRDLDRRLPQLIAEEIPFLAAESVVVPLLPGEDKLLTADSYTEEIPLAQGTWYKVHRFIKVDQAAWQGIYNRFQQAKLVARLETLGLSFGGLLLVIGVVYLVLRRTPRVVDPTLETFSTT
jgi:hypothetical protein